MKKAVLILLSLTITLTAGWWRTYGGSEYDGGYSVLQTEDDGYIVTGYRDSEYDYDFDSRRGKLWVLMTDENGDTLWSRLYGESYAVGYCIAHTEDCGYLVTGSDSSKIFYFKIDSIGDTIWSKKVDNWGEGMWGEQTSDGGFILTGLKEGYFYILKTDAYGNKLWDSEGGGFYVHNWGCCVREKKDGGYIASGLYWWQNYPEEDQHQAVYIIKNNSSGTIGNYLSFHPLQVYDESGVDYPSGWCVIEDDNGNFLIAANGYGVPTVFKIDSNSNEIWWKEYGNYITGNTYCIDRTGDGNFIVCGKVSPRPEVEYAYILKINGDGDSLWMRTFGESGIDCRWVVYSVQQTSDGGFIMTGAKDGDLLLLKTDSLGLLAGEEPVTPETQPGFVVGSAVGEYVLLSSHSEERSQLGIFDASGRLVDELILDGLGTITWGEGFSPGVYFIRGVADSRTQKVVLIR